MDYSPPECSVYGILQARILECGAIPFSRWSSPPRDQIQVSCIWGRFFTREASDTSLNTVDKYYYSSICWQEDNGSSKGDRLWIRILPFPLSTCMRLGELLHFPVLLSSLHLWNGIKLFPLIDIFINKGQVKQLVCYWAKKNKSDFLFSNGNEERVLLCFSGNRSKNKLHFTWKVEDMKESEYFSVMHIS